MELSQAYLHTRKNGFVDKDIFKVMASKHTDFVQMNYKIVQSVDQHFYSNAINFWLKDISWIMCRVF